MPPLPDEGYIKFRCDWQKSAPFPPAEIAALNHWRQKLYDVQLVGAYPDGIGFGNVSQRTAGDQFYISGSKTGNEQQLDHRHYTKVTDFDIQNNWVQCIGPIIASSESMSHAVIYQQDPAIQAVFHVHHLTLWEKVLYQIPTTPPAAPYGSPEMAEEIIRLFQTTEVRQQKVLAMAGHREGLFSFGESLEEAGESILALLKSRLI